MRWLRRRRTAGGTTSCRSVSAIGRDRGPRVKHQPEGERGDRYKTKIASQHFILSLLFISHKTIAPGVAADCCTFCCVILGESIILVEYFEYEVRSHDT